MAKGAGTMATALAKMALALVALASTACSAGADPSSTVVPLSPTPAATQPPTPTFTPTPRPIETACIDYGDGAREGTSVNEQGQVLAVLFSPPSPGRWQVTHLRYRILRNPVPFDAAVFSRQQSELIRQRTEPTATGLVEVDISARNVIVDGDFYGALVYLQGSPGNAASFGPFIGRDSSMPDERSWVTRPGVGWKTWKQHDIDERFGLGDGDFAIIACVRGPL